MFKIKNPPIGLEYLVAVDFMIYQLIVTVLYQNALVLCCAMSFQSCVNVFSHNIIQ